MIPLKDENPARIFPYVTIFIIVINILVFLYQLSLGLSEDVFVAKTAIIPYEIVHFADVPPKGILPPPLTLLTAMFVHGGIFHLLGNMLYLWIFGNNIEDRLGHLLYIPFYLFTGIVASVAHIITQPESTVPLIGASGAIAGVLGAYFVLFPKAKIKTLVFLGFYVTIVRIPAWIFLGIWFVYQFAYQILTSAAGISGGVAWYAHIGGFAAGIVVILIHKILKNSV